MRSLWTSIEEIIRDYNGSQPFAQFLKGYFKNHPILGSRDRRAISEATYAWYRCSKAFPDAAPVKEKAMAALALTGSIPKILAQEAATQEIKLRPDNTAIFPHDVVFSAGISREEWRASLLSQPRLFLRIRKPIAEDLLKGDIPFEILSDTCIALPNGTKAESILPPDAYWIMDASSQKTGDYFHAQKEESWWDCCSGAGGKSLLLKHLETVIRLTVSDIRASILRNLKQRFKQYHLPLPESIVVDVSDDNALYKSLAGRSFDAIICDAPCTGSGTWARTPEGAYFFKEESLAVYAARQKAILCNAANYLKPRGKIIYITCSVFREENEAVVAHAIEKTPLTVESTQLINGISVGADCLFVAVLRKTL